MKFRHRSTLAATALLAATFSIGAYAQGIRIQNRLIPESSIEHPSDIGLRAHTHLQIRAGLPGGGTSGAASFTITRH
jgi:hypothetical protein